MKNIFKNFPLIFFFSLFSLFTCSTDLFSQCRESFKSLQTMIFTRFFGSNLNLLSVLLLLLHWHPQNKSFITNFYKRNLFAESSRNRTVYIECTQDSDMKGRKAWKSSVIERKNSNTSKAFLFFFESIFTIIFFTQNQLFFWNGFFQLQPSVFLMSLSLPRWKNLKKSLEIFLSVDKSHVDTMWHIYPDVNSLVHNLTE